MISSPHVTDAGFVTVAEAAEFLAVGITKIYDLIANGFLPSIQVGRSRRIPKNGLRQYANARLSEQNNEIAPLDHNYE